MLKTFAIKNVKCESCAQFINHKLKNFKNIAIDLSVTPRVIRVDIEESEIPLFKKTLLEAGYPIIDEELPVTTEIKAYVKSYISCMIGKAQ